MRNSISMPSTLPRQHFFCEHTQNFFEMEIGEMGNAQKKATDPIVLGGLLRAMCRETAPVPKYGNDWVTESASFCFCSAKAEARGRNAEQACGRPGIEGAIFWLASVTDQHTIL